MTATGTRLRWLAGGLTIVLAVVLAAVGGYLTAAPARSPAPTQRPSGTIALAMKATPGAHGSADETFVLKLVPHHLQAFELARLAVDRNLPGDLDTLARRIEAAVTPEIDAMNGWVDDWGTASSVTARPGEYGVVTDARVRALGRLRGAAFARAFLRLMMANQRGAVQLALRELDRGTSPDALALAASVAIAENANVREIQQLLTRLG